ncbi:fibronectin type III domain-containing protein [Porticoccaceae bacterium]|nr:fibronectin type III domain-containing protein [Porticoccaceae bacterium]
MRLSCLKQFRRWGDRVLAFVCKAKYLSIFISGIFLTAPLLAHDNWQPTVYSPTKMHAPTPMPDRVVLTWEDDPATTQSVTWRTDITVKEGVAHLALANANGRALETTSHKAKTSAFSSDINDANYHTVTFRELDPNTLYTYRVGDGVNFTEYYHFRTANADPSPFSFIYFGDAQNEVRTHWSRVFREAFRDAPRAAFTLHAGDLVDENYSDAEWGDWHQGPDWVNGTIPVIATPGNHEYRRIEQGPESERFWRSKSGDDINVEILSSDRQPTDRGTVYKVSFVGPDGNKVSMEFNDSGEITQIDKGIESITGFTQRELMGTRFYKPPLYDRQREPGIPAVTTHWRPQFAFPVQDVPADVLAETVYYIDYQGVRFISLDSNHLKEAQVPWFRNVLKNNPNRWTVVTFHHPAFSPAADRDNPELRNLWKPILDEFKVDLVLSGHDHTYARTGQVDTSDLKNVPEGYQHAYDPEIGTVHVVSVSGPKMYKITKGDYAKRLAEDTQLYQIIDIDHSTLRYRAFKATGELYDEFTLKKRAGRPNLLVEGDR